MKYLLCLTLLLGSQFLIAQGKPPFKKSKSMQIAVWDTYVKKKDGSIMHFDIMAPTEQRDTNVIYSYGRNYLESKGQEGQVLSAKECRFCHVEMIKPQWEADIKSKGYFIFEMENCNE